MPEHLKALVVILFLASSVFYFLQKPAREIIGSQAFSLRRNLWFGVTLVAFLAHNYWIYVFLTWLLLFVALPREKNKFSLFIVLLFTVPGGGFEVPGFGLINYFFLLNHQRLLSLVILLPLFLKLVSGTRKPGSKGNVLDTFVILYILLCVVLQLRGTTITDAMRGAFYLFLDVYLPYYVVSRSLTNINDYKDTLFSYITVILILSALGAFELVKHWHLYTGMTDVLGLQQPSGYLRRDGLLRAFVSLQVIPLGYVIALGLGFHLFFRNFYPRVTSYHLVTMGLVVGLISPLSRGPWVGAAAMICVYFLFSPHKLRRLSWLVGGGTVFIVAASFTPMAGTLMGLIPFVGEIESSNITYRQTLITNSWVVIQRNPLLGSIDYLLAPELEELRNGQGIIDIVNTYISVMLKYGLIGLSLFAGTFAIASLKVFLCFTRNRDLDDNERNLGKILLATLVCIVITISTVSSISAIPVMYWIVLGMCSGYARMIQVKKREKLDALLATQRRPVAQY